MEHALPFYSVDTEEQAENLRTLLCALHSDRHPNLPEGEPWYFFPFFGGEIEDIDAAGDQFERMDDV